VIVVGGGFSGLSTAHALMRREPGKSGAGVEVTVLERSDRLGGKICTADFAGLPVDVGPDAILARSPLTRAFLSELGLDPELSHPVGRQAYIWSRGALRPLPMSSLFGVPRRPLALVRSGLLSPWGALRAGADLLLPRSVQTADPSIAELLRPRFGPQVFDRLIDPLLGGIHAGRAETLSARSAVPEVYRLLDGTRSAYLALRGGAEPPTRPTVSEFGVAPAPAPGMVTTTGGLHRLVQALAGALRAGEPAGDVRTGVEATSITRDGTGFVVNLAGGEHLVADDVVLTTPAFVSARLLRDLSPVAAAALAEIPSVGVASVLFAYRKEDLGRPLDGSGFLVPPNENRLIVGSTWSSEKWPHLAGGEFAVLRCSVGRYGDDRWKTMSDSELAARCHDELVAAIGLRGKPVQTAVQRWPDAMPQYTVGHERRLAALAVGLGEHPGLHVTGAALRGAGLAGCLQQATELAHGLLARPSVAISTSGRIH
jgi:oxygen-dependent protoporphyrinogen oxidase